MLQYNLPAFCKHKIFLDKYYKNSFLILENKTFFQNVNLTRISAIFINTFFYVYKKRSIVLKYLLDLDEFYALAILAYGPSECNRFFLST